MKNGNGKRIFKSFEKWHEIEVAKAFGLTRLEQPDALRAWLHVEGEIPPEFQKELESLRKLLSVRALSWNETELLVGFIAPFLHTISFRNLAKELEEFSQRRLELTTDEYGANGVVDWMLARGAFEPQKPYFFLHEYKRFKQRDSDPRGQLLIAMLAAQRTNNDGNPVYGAWIAGVDWRFVLLESDQYSESKAYDATDREELAKIWLILNKTKYIIYDRVDKLIQLENQ